MQFDYYLNGQKTSLEDGLNNSGIFEIYPDGANFHLKRLENTNLYQILLHIEGDTNYSYHADGYIPVSGRPCSEGRGNYRDLLFEIGDYDILRVFDTTHHDFVLMEIGPGLSEFFPMYAEHVYRVNSSSEEKIPLPIMIDPMDYGKLYDALYELRLLIPDFDLKVALDKPGIDKVMKRLTTLKDPNKIRHIKKPLEDLSETERQELKGSADVLLELFGGAHYLNLPDKDLTFFLKPNGILLFYT